MACASRQRFLSSPTASRLTKCQSSPLGSAGSTLVKKAILQDVGFFESRNKTHLLESEEELSPKSEKEMSPRLLKSVPIVDCKQKHRPISAPARALHMLHAEMSVSPPSSPSKATLRQKSPEKTLQKKRSFENVNSRQKSPEKTLQKKLSFVIDETTNLATLAARDCSRHQPGSDPSPTTDCSVQRVSRPSRPCLKIATAKRPGSASKLGQRILHRRVQFGDGHELFEAFTPYGKKYGADPDDFYFDDQGSMVLLSSSQSDVDALDVNVDETIECLVDAGLHYYSKPHLSSKNEKWQILDLGEQVVVQERCGDWVRDSIGWLPLLHKVNLKERPAFEVIVPKEELRKVTARVAVMCAAK